MVFDLIYFFNISCSFIIGFYLLFKLQPSYENLHVKSLAWYYIFNAFCFSFYLLIKYKYILYVSYLYKVPAPITYLVAPMAYFHVKFLSNEQVVLKKYDALHFIPFIVFTFSYFEFYFMELTEKQNYVYKVVNNFNLSYEDSVGLIPEYINSIGRFIHPLFYLILQWIIIYKNRSKFVLSNSNKLFQWVFKFTLLQSIYMLSLFLTIVLLFIHPEINEKFNFSYFPLILTIIFFFSLSIYLFWNQEILTKLKSFQPINVLNSETLQNNFEKISKTVIEKKYFVDPNLNLSKISILLEINSKDLSLIINSQNLNYNSWLNNIRIQHSKNLIKEGFLKRYSIEALAVESGFNSKNTFYRAFKRITEITPKEYHNSFFLHHY